MPGNHLFEYAVIRIVPRVEREEFLNVGVILYCQEEKFLQTAFELDEIRLRSFYANIDLGELRDCLNSFVQISRGSSEGGPISRLDMASRFRWLTATRSTVVQISKTHPGLCDNASETLSHLIRQLVV
jgi:hypothetical protein